jgi:hypothetical protein
MLPKKAVVIRLRKHLHDFAGFLSALEVLLDLDPLWETYRYYYLLLKLRFAETLKNTIVKTVLSLLWIRSGLMRIRRSG